MLTETTRTVRFLGGSKDQCTWRGHDDPRQLLTVGRTYEVFAIKVSDSYTTLRLSAYPEMRFNSVMFEAADDNDD